MSVLPIRGAEEAVQVDQSWWILAIGPSVTPAVEVDLFERKLVNQSPEAAHHPSIEVGVLIFLAIDEIEIPAQQPWSGAGSTHGAQFLQELNLIGLALRNHHGEPVDVGIFAESVLVVNSGSVTVTTRLFQARRIPPQVPRAERYT